MVSGLEGSRHSNERPNYVGQTRGKFESCPYEAPNVEEELLQLVGRADAALSGNVLRFIDGVRTHVCREIAERGVCRRRS